MRNYPWHVSRSCSQCNILWLGAESGKLHVFYLYWLSVCHQAIFKILYSLWYDKAVYDKCSIIIFSHQICFSGGALLWASHCSVIVYVTICVRTVVIHVLQFWNSLSVQVWLVISLTPFRVSLQAFLLASTFVCAPLAAQYMFLQASIERSLWYLQLVFN